MQPVFLFTAGYTDSIPTSLSQPAATLPLAIFFQLSSPIQEVQNRAYAAALILTVIVLVISLGAKYFSKKLSKKQNMTFEAPHIRVKDLNVYIGHNHILKNISLDIPDKKIHIVHRSFGLRKNNIIENIQPPA